MAVTKEIARLEHSALKMTITVGKEDARSQYDELINDYVKTVQIPGFRKGKVPREVLERKFGPALKDEALNKIIGKTISSIFEDEQFPKEDQPLPYSTPRLEDEPVFEFDKDMAFSIVYDVFPKVSVGPWKGFEVEIPDVEVSEEDLKYELEEIRDRNAIVLDRDDGAAAVKNDVVTVDYCELDGNKNPVKETERQDFVFTLGTGYNVYKFDDDVEGMKKGETKDITKTFPADFADGDIAGKTLDLRIRLTALKEKKLPDLDDDLAQDVDEKYQTLDDLKNSIKERLNKNLEKRVREISISRILEKIMEGTPIDLPESMIRVQIESHWRNLSRQFNIEPDELERNFEKAGRDTTELKESWKGSTEKELKSRLIVETLMKDLGLEASDEEAEKEIESIAGASDSPVEEVKKYYEQENAREYLRENIAERKLCDMLLAENKITKGKKERYAEVMADKAHE